MSNIKTFYCEYGMSGKLQGGKSYHVVGAELTDLEASDYLFAANIDATAYIVLCHIGLVQNSTYAWLPAHCIEKYLKAYLMLCDDVTVKMLRNWGHDISCLWSKYKERYQFGEIANLEEYISEVAALTIDVRYGNTCVIFNDNLLSGLIFFVGHFNKFKKGSSFYPKTYYGLVDSDLPAMNFLSKNYLKGIVRTYLHLAIEHQIIVSASGISHPHKYNEVNFLKQNRFEENCPFCNGTAKLDIRQKGITNELACESVKSFFEFNTKQDA